MGYRTLGQLRGRCLIGSDTSPRNKFGGVIEPFEQPDGTAFVAAGEDVLSTTVNRGLAALAENTDILFRLTQTAKIEWVLINLNLTGVNKIHLADYLPNEYVYIGDIASVKIFNYLSTQGTRYYRPVYSDAGKFIYATNFIWNGSPITTPHTSHDYNCCLTQFGIRIDGDVTRQFQPGLIVELSECAYTGQYLIVHSAYIDGKTDIILSNRIGVDNTNLRYSDLLEKSPFASIDPSTAVPAVARIKYDVFYPVSDAGKFLEIQLSDVIGSEAATHLLLPKLSRCSDTCIRFSKAEALIQDALPQVITLDDVYRGINRFNRMAKRPPTVVYANLDAINVESSGTVDGVALAVTTTEIEMGVGVAPSIPLIVSSHDVASLLAGKVLFKDSEATLNRYGNTFFIDADTGIFETVWYGLANISGAFNIGKIPFAYCKIFTSEKSYYALVDLGIPLGGGSWRYYITFLGDSPNISLPATVTVYFYGLVQSLGSELAELSVFDTQVIGEPYSWKDELLQRKKAILTLLGHPWFADSTESDSSKRKKRHSNRYYLYVPIDVGGTDYAELSHILGSNIVQFCVSAENSDTGRAKIILSALDGKLPLGFIGDATGIYLAGSLINLKTPTSSGVNEILMHQNRITATTGQLAVAGDSIVLSGYSNVFLSSHNFVEIKGLSASDEVIARVAVTDQTVHLAVSGANNSFIHLSPTSLQINGNNASITSDNSFEVIGSQGKLRVSDTVYLIPNRTKETQVVEARASNYSSTTDVPRITLSNTDDYVSVGYEPYAECGISQRQYNITGQSYVWLDLVSLIPPRFENFELWEQTSGYYKAVKFATNQNTKGLYAVHAMFGLYASTNILLVPFLAHFKVEDEQIRAIEIFSACEVNVTNLVMAVQLYGLVWPATNTHFAVGIYSPRSDGSATIGIQDVPFPVGIVAAPRFSVVRASAFRNNIAPNG